MFGNKVRDLRVIETNERGIEFSKTVCDGEGGAIGEVLAAFEFKGIELSALSNLTL